VAKLAGEQSAPGASEDASEMGSTADDGGLYGGGENSDKATVN